MASGSSIGTRRHDVAGLRPVPKDAGVMRLTLMTRMSECKTRLVPGGHHNTEARQDHHRGAAVTVAESAPERDALRLRSPPLASAHVHQVVPRERATRILIFVR